MPRPVVAGSTCFCTMGGTGVLKPSDLTAPSFGGKPALNITDSKPIVNIGSCGLCRTTANPVVANATALAQGVLTPMPCVPSTQGAWLCPSTIPIKGKMLLTTDGKIMCQYGGMIKIVDPGQQNVTQK